MKHFLLIVLALLPCAAFAQGIIPGGGGGGGVAGVSSFNGAIGAVTYGASNLLGLVWQAPRQYLSATQPLWVTPTGSDANNCLLATPCATAQAAVNAVYSLFDSNGKTVTINLTSGNTYTGPIVIAGPLPGGGVLSIVGNGGVATLSNNANLITASNGARVSLTNLTLTTTGTGIQLSSQYGAEVVGNRGITFGASGGSQIEAENSGVVIMSHDYTISGGATSHIHFHAGGQVILDGDTITCTGTPLPYSQYFVGGSGGGSYLRMLGGTIDSSCNSGGVVGFRFTLNRGAVIRTDTNNIDFFPGTIEGTFASNAVFDDYGDGGIRQRAVTSGNVVAVAKADQTISMQSPTGVAKSFVMLQCTSTGPWTQYTLKDDYGDAGTVPWTITANSGSTIDGQASYTMQTSYGSLMLLCDGNNNYQVISPTTPPAYQVFTVSGSFSFPPWTHQVCFAVLGGGSSGANGHAAASGTATSGAAGGSTGGFHPWDCHPASEFTSPVGVTVATATGVPVGDGAAGNTGGLSCFGTYCESGGGAPSGGATTASASGGSGRAGAIGTSASGATIGAGVGQQSLAGVTGQAAGNSGLFGSSGGSSGIGTAAAQAGSGEFGAGAGGAGAPVNATPAALNGGAGGRSGQTAGGTAGINGTDSGNAAALTCPTTRPGPGGGGGANGIGANAGNGADGCLGAGGGGGGSAEDATKTFGVGGKGGGGLVLAGYS